MMHLMYTHTFNETKCMNFMFNFVRIQKCEKMISKKLIWTTQTTTLLGKGGNFAILLSLFLSNTRSSFWNTGTSHRVT